MYGLLNARLPMSYASAVYAVVGCK